MATTEPATAFALGTQVDVFSRFRDAWVSGFEIASVTGDGYALRRHIDWAVLPGTFSSHDLRIAHSGFSPAA